MTDQPVVAVLGGTGAEGRGIALRLARAGHAVVIGSRDAAKARRIAAELCAKAGLDRITGADNREAAEKAEVVFLTVPYSAEIQTVRDVQPALAGKILVDTTAPLVPPRVARVQLPEGGSAVAAVQAMLGDAVRVVSAFQNVAAHQLADLDHAPDCDVLVCGDDPKARDVVIGLAREMGLRAVHAGPIANSAAAEALTSILISINSRYKVPGGAGIRITGAGIDAQAAPAKG